ncbi:alanine dehydrogenase [Xanthovirga aplysinae]|uniref:alanine dehydrogenase n=1 Tax=Xanthovirga aplysinae TaxID=2529853 RepID=UPI0012BD0748|nr:alanine dehydrogenase [Xanthovirga aplysinae]MTI30963.1 alanine dehydrogenase [Xanthovirga aplysinae]
MSSKRYSSEIEALAKEGSLYPQESLLKTRKDRQSLFIGIPREIQWQENRIALTPGAVEVLVSNGHEIWVETEAGLKSNYSDKDFSDAGAKIVYSSKEVYQADIVIKVEPPVFSEINYLKPGGTLISAIQLGNQSPEYIHALNERKITAIAFELLENKVGELPVVRAMSEIAGSTVTLIAAEYLSSVRGGQGILLGEITGVPPAKVMILGAGTVAEYAARAAIGLGAQIQIYDTHIYKLRRIKHVLNQQVHTAAINSVTLTEELKSTDVLIGAIRPEKGRNRCVVTEEMVSQMKPNSVIIDVSIDQGGCIETSVPTTHNNPVYKRFDVIHYCVPNIPSRVARTATTALSNTFTSTMLHISETGGIENMILTNQGFMKGVYTFKGSLTNASIAQKFNLKYKDLNLLMAARF